MLEQQPSSDGIETSHIYEFLLNNYTHKKGKKLFALEGSSGAGKTWGAIDFIFQYCRIHSFENKVITIGRETYKDCMETVADDFIKRLKMIDWYDVHSHKQSHPQSYRLFGNRIDFTGWSNNGQPSKRQDGLWFNEILESQEENFKQYNQRTNDFVIFDWNPKVTEHWVYNKLLDRPDCNYLHCLMLDAPFLPLGQRQELLAYEPNAINIKNGTADEFMWKVYGLGVRCNPQGVIFNNVRWIDQFPAELGYIYGMDFGFVSDPTAIVKYSETPTDIYAELLCYEPMDNANIIHDYAIKKGINIAMPVIADNADKYTSEFKGTVQMVRDLNNLGWINIEKVRKNKTVVYWLGSMKQKRLNLVRNEFQIQLKREVENYKNREIHGIVVNDPVDKWNHALDAIRYPHMHLHQMEEMAM